MEMNNFLEKGQDCCGIFGLGGVFFFFKVSLLKIWNQEGEVTFWLSASTSSLFWHFPLKTAFMPLFIALKRVQKASCRNLCFFPGFMQECASVGQWLPGHNFYAPGKDLVCKLKATHCCFE